MYDLVNKHKRIAQLILALIALPFAFFGVDYYFRSGEQSPGVATVAGEKITQAEFYEMMREQQDRLRQQLGRNFDPAIFDNPEVRFQLLGQLVDQRLLQNKGKQEGFRVTDAQLQQFIADLPVFQENGRFSPDKYRQLLAGQNLTPQVFESRVRGELTLAPLQEPVALGGIVARGSGERYLALVEQQREIAIASVDAEPFAKDVRVDDAAIKAFYDANPTAFQTPEQAKVEFVTLTLDALMAQSAVEAAEVRAKYDADATVYTQAEERQAAHILIAVKPDASDADKAAAKKKAEELTAQAKANPARFAELAKANSQDPGSAAQGGDLGTFARGNMVKPFDDAVFALKPGEIVGPVQTDFGWHVIRLAGVTPAKTRPFDEVKGQIESDLKRQKATQKFAASADQFQNLVYEQGDSLGNVAKTLGLAVQTTPWITRAQAQGLAQGNAKLLAALFAPESIQGKRSTEAIEVAPNTLVAARIVEYKPAAPRPLADVADEIRRQLVRKGASEMANKVGREKLALLEQGKSDKEVGIAFGKPVAVLRNQMQPGVSPEGLAQIFRIDPARVPSYVGAGNERGGFSIYRLVKVIDPALDDPAKLAAAGQRVGDQLGRELFSAYLAALKAKSEVKIDQANLEKK
jgi:peptidyl-prolyl cis-trans isomerase D